MRSKLPSFEVDGTQKKNVCHIVLLLLGIGFALAGCRNDAVQHSGAKREIRVAAAANLKFAFDEIVNEFKSENSGIEVSVTYGSSGNFFAQLSNKAPFDVFLSADVEYPRKLVDKGLATRGSEFIYAVGRIVVWVSNSSTLEIEKLGIGAIADPSVRKIAIANPKHAPYGRAAEAALKKLNVYEKVQERLVFGENIEQAAQFVHGGAADVGIISLSLALSPAMKERCGYWVVPPDAHPPLEQSGVILSWATGKEDAERLCAFLLGASGREVLKRYGYDFPDQPKE